jgi:hypothetical protein
MQDLHIYFHLFIYGLLYIKQINSYNTLIIFDSITPELIIKKMMVSGPMDYNKTNPNKNRHGIHAKGKLQRESIWHNKAHGIVHILIYFSIFPII